MAEAKKKSYDHIKFDKHRHHGTIHPPTDEGAHYEQDGFFFGSNGKLVEELLTPEAIRRLEKAEARRIAAEAARAASVEAMKKLGYSEEDLDEEAKKELGNIVAPGAVDLVAWAKGHVNYKFFAVRKAAIDHYAFNPANTQALVEFMVAQGLVSEEQARQA